MAVTEIVYGLGGLIAGAILTGATDAFNRWHERRLAKRAAARAIFSDLYWAREALEDCLKDEDWADALPPRSSDWLEYRDALSNGLSGAAFHRIAGAYHELQVLDWAKSRKEPFDSKRMKSALERFEQAEAILEKESLTRRDRLWMKLRGHKLTTPVSGGLG